MDFNVFKEMIVIESLAACAGRNNILQLDQNFEAHIQFLKSLLVPISEKSWIIISALSSYSSREYARILRCFLSRDADNLKVAFCIYVVRMSDLLSNTLFRSGLSALRKILTYMYLIEENVGDSSQNPY